MNEDFPACQKIQILDHGSIQLVDRWGSDEAIIEAARMSVQKGFKGWGGRKWKCSRALCDWTGEGDYSRNDRCPKCDVLELVAVPGDEKLLAYLWKNKHETPFEMAGVTIEVQAPIFVFREWHRHRVPFGYNEASARYSPLPDLNYVPTIERLMIGAGSSKQSGAIKDARVLDDIAAQAFRYRLEESYAFAQGLYEKALNSGVPKELARLVLPVGRYSKMRATGNLRGWLGFLKLRMSEHAQYEIREYACGLHKILKSLHPRTMELFDESRR